LARELAHAGLQTAAFCASGAHDQQVAARRFSKATIFAPAWANSRANQSRTARAEAIQRAGRFAFNRSC